jgi:CBS domain-containing protein
MKVHEFMTPMVVAVSPKTPLRQILQLMLRRHLNNVLVIDGQQALLGIVTYSDLSRKLLPTYEDLAAHEEYILTPASMEERVMDVASTPVEDIMTRKVVTVSPDLEVLKAGATMTAHRVKQLPVVCDGRVVGIISHTDIGWGLMVQYPECLMGESHATYA